ncbi:MAG: iron hydrogenase small subunit, partial [Spirochaetales bacterium]|nr:iron hydrogenase small subunit [Spirochaetales bacterium]
TINIGGTDVSVAVASGTGNASTLLDSVRDGKKNYAFIEVMACPGGCVNGGGQPIVSAQVKMEKDIRVERAKALYNEDSAKALRKSHDNTEIKTLYTEYLGKPGSHKAHELLHTHYQKREKYSD